MFPICDGVSVKFRSSASNRVNGSSVKPASVEVYVGLGAVNQALMFVVPCSASFVAVAFCFLLLFVACFTWYWRMYVIKHLIKSYDKYN